MITFAQIRTQKESIMKKSMVWMLLLGVFFSLELCAQDFVVDRLEYNILSKEDMTVEVGCSDTEIDSITVPSHVLYNDTLYTVTTLRIQAFTYCSSLSYISLPHTLEKISHMALCGYPNLEGSITIPPSVKSIGSSAFNNQRNLKHVILPEGIEYVGQDCFKDCNSLEDTIYIRKDVTYGSSVYAFCPKIKQIVIEEGVTSIPDYMFKNFDEMIPYPEPLEVEEIVFPESVDTIGRSAFALSKLKTLKLPSCKVMRKEAFRLCKWLETITFGSKVEYVNQGAFGKCNSLKTIYCEGTVPPKEGLYMAGVTLHVPKGYKEIYATTDNWAKYGDNIVDDIELEGIRSINNEELKMNNEMFDLQGRRITEPQKGKIYIQKGKKYINK